MILMYIRQRCRNIILLKENEIMTISGVLALVAGAVTATCAIAGAISGIRARKAAERRAEEMRRAEHLARLEEIKNRNRQYVQTIQYVPAQSTPQVHYISTEPTVQYVPARPSPGGGEIYHYYHNIPQPQTPVYPTQDPYQNQAYNCTEPVWRGEQEIGARSRMNYFQNLRNMFFPQYQQQYGYYPQAHYAYAV
jgi:hypothetical protein